MASDMNVWAGTGRLTRDPELTYTQGGASVAKFSIAVNYGYGKSGERKEQVSFFNCVAWAKLGEVIAQYAHKGDAIAISGRLQQRSWDDQSGNKRSTVEIVVNEVKFLSGKKDGKVDEAAAKVTDAFGEDDIDF